MTYDILSEPETPGKFNAHHLSVKNLAATLSLKALRSDSLNAAIRRVSFDEQCGFSLQKFAMKVTANNKRLDIKDFGVELSNTALNIDSLTLKYDSLPELPQMTENVRYDGSLKASVILKDLAPFVPALSRFEEPLDLNLVFSGHGKHLDCPTLRLTNHHGLMIAGEAALSNWDAGMDMYIYGKLGNLTMTKEGINVLMTNLTGKVPPFCNVWTIFVLTGKRRAICMISH